MEVHGKLSNLLGDILQLGKSMKSHSFGSHPVFFLLLPGRTAYRTVELGCDIFLMTWMNSLLICSVMRYVLGSINEEIKIYKNRKKFFILFVSKYQAPTICYTLGIRAMNDR